MARFTKKEAVYEYMKSHREEGITSWEAIQKFGVTRLAAIIYNLKEDGILIRTESVRVTTRFGESAPIARYFYLGETRPEQLSLEGLK